MRFGIGATSGMRPKLLRMRFLPVNDLAIASPQSISDVAHSRPLDRLRAGSRTERSALQNFRRQKAKGCGGPHPGLKDPGQTRTRRFAIRRIRPVWAMPRGAY